VVSSKLDPDKQAAFIKQYDNLLNHMGDDEAVLSSATALMAGPRHDRMAG